MGGPRTWRHGDPGRDGYRIGGFRCGGHVGPSARCGTRVERRVRHRAAPLGLCPVRSRAERCRVRPHRARRPRPISRERERALLDQLASVYGPPERSLAHRHARSGDADDRPPADGRARGHRFRDAPRARDRGYTAGERSARRPAAIWESRRFASSTNDRSIRSSSGCRRPSTGACATL